MPINEIEIPGSSISFKVFQFAVAQARRDTGTKNICDALPKFDLAKEDWGAHDFEVEPSILRGFYSAVVAFEVDCLNEEGETEAKQMKRIDTLELLATGDLLFVWGKASPQKQMIADFMAASGVTIIPLEFEFAQMSQFHDRLKQLKSISLQNPKDKEIKKIVLTGHIEDYTTYNVLDARDHGIEKVSGLADTTLGPMTVTVTRKGGLRLGVRKGFLLTVECLLWLVRLIRDDKAPTARKTEPTMFD